MIVNGAPGVKIQIFYVTQDGNIANAEISNYMTYGALEQMGPHTNVVVRYDPNDIFAVGALVSIGDTSIVNGNAPRFVLTFSYYLEDGSQVMGRTRHDIDVGRLPEYKCGMLCILKYKKGNPEKVKLLKDDSEIINNKQVQNAMWFYYVVTGQKTMEWWEVLATGIEGTCQILSSKPTGRMENGCGELAFNLMVTRPDGSVYELTTTKFLTHVQLPYSLAGKVLSITYDKDDETNVVINFGAQELI